MLVLDVPRPLCGALRLVVDVSHDGRSLLPLLHGVGRPATLATVLFLVARQDLLHAEVTPIRVVAAVDAHQIGIDHARPRGDGLRGCEGPARPTAALVQNVAGVEACRMLVSHIKMGWQAAAARTTLGQPAGLELWPLLPIAVGTCKTHRPMELVNGIVAVRGGQAPQSFVRASVAKLAPRDGHTIRRPDHGLEHRHQIPVPLHDLPIYYKLVVSLPAHRGRSSTGQPDGEAVDNLCLRGQRLPLCDLRLVAARRG
mmetsp:Transcript_98097/g.245849  ORF Transcript_98097/g.245849 Transcript_98097/m.245849 type:complete len:256 (-) Transcript_98097:881-1648(-)